jgi:hypothetical protein
VGGGQTELVDLSTDGVGFLEGVVHLEWVGRLDVDAVHIGVGSGVPGGELGVSAREVVHGPPEAGIMGVL